MEQLIEFLKYVRDNHAEEMARQSLKDAREMQIPILKLFEHIPEEAMVAQSIKGTQDFVNSLIDGTYEQRQIDNLKLWEEDKLPGISKNSIEPSDLVLIYILQKKSYFKFIPQYTQDAQLAIDIVMQMEQLHLKSQLAGINLMFNMRKKIETELEITNKELEAFSYSVSHDLRAPLRAIHGFTKILKDDYGSKLDSEGIDMMNSVMKNTEKMGLLIDDLLAFSRLGRKEIQVSKVNMTELAKDALAEVKANDGGFKGRVTVYPLQPVMADHSLMYQVLANLISNAIKYSAKKENPVVEVSCEAKDNELVYCVKDNGVGFNMKYYDKLFGVFQRLHSNNDFDGTGIGLALVKRIINRHGGNVWAEGEPDKGASFYFSLKN